jgi:Flp pilus assembly protein TadG
MKHVSCPRSSVAVGPECLARRRVIRGLARPARRGRWGVAAAELAVCLPILLLFIIGAVECCSMIYVDQTLAIASYEGVRAAIRFDATSSDVEAKSQTILDARRVSGATIVIDPSDVGQAPRGTPITVSVSAPCSENNVLTTWFFTDKTLTETSKMIKE